LFNGVVRETFRVTSGAAEALAVELVNPAQQVLERVRFTQAGDRVVATAVPTELKTKFDR